MIDYEELLEVIAEETAHRNSGMTRLPTMDEQELDFYFDEIAYVRNHKHRREAAVRAAKRHEDYT